MHTLRYGRMPKADIEELCVALSDDVMTLLRACPSLLVVLLCDGAKELWNVLGKEFTCSGLGHPVHRLVELGHLHRADMNYAQGRKLGLPVGSGNVEATCKSLFEVRLKRPGCRWKESTGAQIVDLRALALSDRYAQGIGLAWAPLRTSVCTLAVPLTKLTVPVSTADVPCGMQR